MELTDICRTVVVGTLITGGACSHFPSFNRIHFAHHPPPPWRAKIAIGVPSTQPRNQERDPPSRLGIPILYGYSHYDFIVGGWRYQLDTTNMGNIVRQSKLAVVKKNHNKVMG